MEVERIRAREAKVEARGVGIRRCARTHCGNITPGLPVRVHSLVLPWLHPSSTRAEVFEPNYLNISPGSRAVSHESGSEAPLSVGLCGCLLVRLFVCAFATCLCQTPSMAPPTLKARCHVVMSRGNDLFAFCCAGLCRCACSGACLQTRRAVLRTGTARVHRVRPRRCAVSESSPRRNRRTDEPGCT